MKAVSCLFIVFADAFCNSVMMYSYYLYFSAIWKDKTKFIDTALVKVSVRQRQSNPSAQQSGYAGSIARLRPFVKKL